MCLFPPALPADPSSSLWTTVSPSGGRVPSWQALSSVAALAPTMWAPPRVTSFTTSHEHWPYYLTSLTSFSSHSVSFLSHIDFILLLHFVSFQSLSWLFSKSVWALSKATVTSFQNNSGLIPKPLWHHSIATLASFQSYSGLILKTLWPHSKNSYGLIPKQLWPHSEATLTSVTFFMSCFMKFLQSIEIPFLKVVKKVKSMQMFRQPVQKASQV